jgi:hypothetical protein
MVWDGNGRGSRIAILACIAARRGCAGTPGKVACIVPELDLLPLHYQHLADSHQR